MLTKILLIILLILLAVMLLNPIEGFIHPETVPSDPAHDTVYTDIPYIRGYYP